MCAARRLKRNCVQVRSTIMGGQGLRIFLVLYSIYLTVTTTSTFILTQGPRGKHLPFPYSRFGHTRLPMSLFASPLADGSSYDNVLKPKSIHCFASWRLGRYKICVNRTDRAHEPGTTDRQYNYLRLSTSAWKLPFLFTTGYRHRYPKMDDANLLKLILGLVDPGSGSDIPRDKRSRTGHIRGSFVANDRGSKLPKSLRTKKFGDKKDNVTRLHRGNKIGKTEKDFRDVKFAKPKVSEEVLMKRQDEASFTQSPSPWKQATVEDDGVMEKDETTDLYDSEEFQEFRRHTETMLGVPVRVGLVKFSPVGGQPESSRRKIEPSPAKRGGTQTAAALSVCPSYSDWLMRREAQDPYGHRLNVLEMIPYNGTLVRQYFYETICIRHNRSQPSFSGGGTSQTSVASGTSECLAVDKQVWNSRCAENYIWTYGKVVKANGDIGWSVIAIRGSCSCSVWPKTLPGGRRAGPRLFIDDLDE
ncbi:uncharacterized protein LOC135400143 [Ornithodoros turicata]|uniref:uncharacterized protein LOC135400143 n=1 Tax=Ornithodoros turicata TaxID=34597 RepID=UPI003139A9B6